MAATAVEPLAPPRQRLSRDGWAVRGLLGLAALWLVVMFGFPLYTLLSKSTQAQDGSFVGLANYATYFATPALSSSIQNSLTVAAISTAITIALAFPFAYALTRSAMPGKQIVKAVALIPLLAPSMLPAISFRYLFGNQGIMNWVMGSYSIYGPIGIVMGEVFYCFPHALLILTTALATADARLFEAALSLKASRPRIFFTVTLPAAKYGIVSAIVVGFTQVITDFGIPKITGGQYNVLATDIYKQVVGSANFSMGAVVGVVLLGPALVAFAIDRLVQRRQTATLTARAVPYEPKPARRFDALMLGYCSFICLLILAILGVAVFASLIRYWPYNLELTLDHYDFDRVDERGWGAYINSLQLAFGTMIVGTAAVFLTAYVVTKTKGAAAFRGGVHLMAMMPLSVPGLVLGLAYIFFFIDPENPLNFLYRTITILVISTVIHYFTVSYLVAVTALKQMDQEFEAVSASLKVPFHRTLRRVTIPVCMPAILDISIYFFVNAMTTTSAVVFLYSSDTMPASVSILNQDETGAIASAAAMGVVIVLTSALVRLIHWGLVRGVLRRTQAWRVR
jgi:iron(III) transport system permease protein